jgi:signal transduction histidine kinase/DNA-binding response OmpR family regulator/ligand-binding sensor domain-containing protein
VLWIITQPVSAVYFKHLGIKDGLSQVSVLSIYQDELGRMWFGTEEGVSVFDGRQIISIKHTEDSIRQRISLIGNQTYPIVGDKNGHVYFRSDDKLICFDVRNEQFSCLKSSNVSTVFCQDATLYVACRDTVYRWNEGNKTLDFLLCANLNGLSIQKIFVDSKNGLWIGYRHGLLLYNGNKREAITPNEDVYDVYEDSQSNIWIATRYGGVYRYDSKHVLSNFRHDPKNPNTIPHNQVRSFTEDNYGNIWTGTFKGLCKYNPNTERMVTYEKSDLPGSLNHSSVFSTYKDRQGTIWVGTYYGGVHYYNPEVDCFSFYAADMRRNDCLSYFYVGKMVEDKDQNLWICTEGGGLNFFDRKTKLFRHYLSGEKRNTIAHDNLKSIVYSRKYEQLYIGTHIGGFSVFDIKKEEFHNFKTERPDDYARIGNIIINLMIYKEDTLLIQGSNGFFKLDLIHGELTRLFDETKYPDVSVFFADSKDYLWLVNTTSVIRMNMNDHNEVVVLDKKDAGFGAFPASCIFEDDENRLFFGTLGSGLYEFDPLSDKFIVYKVENNLLQSNYCYDIASSELKNELIVSGNKGLSFLNVNKKTLRTMDLNSLLFSGIYYGCGMLVCRNGEVFVGGIDGMTSFFEQEVFKIRKDYNLYFSSLSVNNERISPHDKTGILSCAFPYQKQIELKYNQNNIHVLYTSNDYIDSRTKNQYRYKLEGFDSRWISGGNNIVYTNIPPGDYRLIVREKSLNDIHAKEITLDIHIGYAWFANPAAYLVYFLMFVLLVNFVLRTRNIQFRLINSLELERKEKARIEELNQAKLQFFSNISHEFRTPLTLMVVQLENLLNGSNISPFVYNKLQKINKHALLLRNLINELLDFRKLEQGYISLKAREQNVIPFLKDIFASFNEMAVANRIRYSFDSYGVNELPVWFDDIQLKKVFYNLLSNAFRFTKSNDMIELTVREEEDAIVIKVFDSGTGIDEEDMKNIFDRFYQADNSNSPDQKTQGTGIGLSVAKGVVELHHGMIWLESKLYYGSVFTVSLLKGKSHFTDDEIAGKDVPAFEKEERKDMSAVEAPACRLAGDGAELSSPLEIEGQKTVLIVEDNEELLHLLNEILSPVYRSLTARNGKEGLDIVRKENVDLVITDIMMPEVSGTELCIKIKNDFETCHIPVILLTALSTQQQIIYGLQHGADDYISKPFDKETLITRCHNLIVNRMIIENKFRNRDTIDIQAIARNPVDQKYLDNINRIIERNFDNPEFDMSQLAGHLHISRSSLYAKFEALTGMTPNDYVLQRKLKRAAELLKNDLSLNISEISDLLSFGSPRYFSRCFKNVYGVTPADFRRKT